MKARPHIGRNQTPPEFIAKTTTLQGALGGVTVQIPAGAQPGDLLLLFVESDGPDPAPTATGWTQIRTQVDPGTAVTRLTCLRKFMEVGETEVTTSDTGDHNIAGMMVFRGVHPTSPIPNSQSEGVDTSVTSVSISALTSTGGPRRMVVYACSSNASGTSSTEFSGWTNATLESVTEGLDGLKPDGNGGGIGTAYGIKTTNGNTGTMTATAVNGTPRAQMTIAIRGLGD